MAAVLVLCVGAIGRTAFAALQNYTPFAPKEPHRRLRRNGSSWPEILLQALHEGPAVRKYLYQQEVDIPECAGVGVLSITGCRRFE